MIRPVALLMIAVGCLGCGSKSAPEASQGDPPQDLAGEYAKGFEARTWLANPSHGMFELGKEETQKLVNVLYAAGAEGVRIVDASKVADDSPVEIAATILYKLPADKAKRAALIAAHNSEFELEGEDLEKDTGQAFGEIVID